VAERKATEKMIRRELNAPRSQIETDIGSQVIQRKIDASGCTNGNQTNPTQPVNCPSLTNASGGLRAGGPNLWRISDIGGLAAPKYCQPTSRRLHGRCCFRRPNLAATTLAQAEWIPRAQQPMQRQHPQRAKAALQGNLPELDQRHRSLRVRAIFTP
jgi:hypothetical protein